jgi:hypothetical protein
MAPAPDQIAPGPRLDAPLPHRGHLGCRPRRTVCAAETACRDPPGTGAGRGPALPPALTTAPRRRGTPAARSRPDRPRPGRG